MALERDVERALVKALRIKGIKHIKLSAISQRGMPDRLVFLPKGKAVFIELKAPGREGTLSENQMTQIRALHQLGYPVLVSSSVAEMLEFIVVQSKED
jgi:Holliday junction resolvase